MTCPRPSPLPSAASRLRRGALVLLGLAAAGLHAQSPAGGTVLAGSATITAAANSTVITAGNNSVLHWNSFDIGAGQTVQFVQPGASARVLNLIGSSNPSQINGALLANGQVYLMNPAGVYFGSTAVVNVGALYAAGGSMTKEDFLAGYNRFSGLTGSVTNAGSIHGEVVALVGRSVANTGTIVSPGGFIGLASGDQVLLGQNGSSIYVDTGQSTASPAAGTGVANSGTIDAGRGTTLLAAGDLYSVAITQSGRLTARNVQLQGQGRGDVLVSGTIDASSHAAGETGGRVEITGERVGLRDGAKVDASGPAGGGTILLGGDFQGKNPDIRNATRTYVGPNATITADATEQGDGGKVVVWADEATGFLGSISARGGAAGGNGGFAEVSGKTALDFRGTVDLTAFTGRTGRLLLDPDNLTIQTATPDVNGDATTGDDVAGDIAATDFGSVTSIITAGQVVTLLGSADLSLAANLSIIVNSAVSWNSTHGLTLDAGNAIFLNAGITNAGTGGVTLNAGTGGISLGASVSSGGAVSFTHTGALTQSAGTVTAATLNLSGDGDVGSSGTHLATDAGTLVLNKTAGDTFISEVSGLALQGTTAGNLDVTTSGAITQGAALSVTGMTTLAAGANAITLTDGANDFTGAVSVSNSGANAVAVTVANALELGTSSVGSGALDITAVGISQSGPITQAASAGAATFNGGAGAITLMDAANNFTGAVSVNNSGAFDVAVTDTDALIVGVSTVGQNLALSAGGNITQNGAITATGGITTVTVTTAASDILLGTQANDLGGSALVLGGVVTNIHDFSLRNTNGAAILPDFTGATLHDLTLEFDSVAIALPALTLTGSLAVTAGGDLTQAGPLVVPGTAAFTAGANAITLTDPANDFTGAVSLSNSGAHDVAVVNNAGLVLGTSSLGSGALDVTSVGGSISQTGAITKTGGASTFTIDTGTAQDILLHTQANDFGGGAVTFTTANGGTIQDIGLRDDNAAASLAGLPSSARNIDLYFGGAAIDLPAVTATGHLNVTSGGDITQSASLGVTGTSSFTAGAHAITLTDSSNDFGGAVSLANSGANDVAVTDANAIDLGTVGVGSGTLDVSAVGITQSGAITQAALAGVAAFNAGAGVITLNNVANDFTGAVSLNNSGANAVTVTDANALVLGTSGVGSSTLTMNAVGITQSGAITQATSAGAATFNGGAGVITLTQANDFTGTVSLNNTGANNVAVTDSNALVLGASAVGSGTLDVTAVGIAQTGGLTQAASAGAATFNAGAGAITLNNGTNDFTGAVSLNNTGANDVTVADTNALDLGPSGVGSGTLTVNAVGLTQSGAITQEASAGVATFNGGAGVITLTQANDFTGTVSLNNNGANDVAITDANALALGASTVGTGTLTINAGATSLSGAITSGATVTFNNSGTLSGGSLVTAPTQVNLTGSGNVTSLNTSTQAIGLATTGGVDVTVINQLNGGLTISGGTAVGLANLTVTSHASDNVTRDTLTIGSGNLTTGTSVTLTGSSLTLNGDITSPTITLNLAGDLTGSKSLAASVALALNGTGNVGATGAGAIHLNTPSLTLNKASGDVFVNNGANALGLTLTAFNGNGEFTSGAFTLNSAINAGSNALTFNTTTFGLGANAVTGGTVTFNNSGALTGSGLVTATTLNLDGLGAVGSGGARLQTAAGAINFSKAATAGDTFLNEADAITLTGATAGAVDITTTGAVSLNNFTATGAGGFTAGGGATVSASGNLSGTFNSAMTLDNNVTLTGVTTFGAAVTLNNGGTLTFDAAGNTTTFSSTVTIGSDVNFTGAGALTFSGALNDTASGGHALTFDTGGTGHVSLLGDVGATTPFKSLSVTGAASVRGTIGTDGNTQNWGNLTLTGDTIFTDNSGNINFNGTVDGDGSGPWALTATTASTTLFSNAVGGTNALASVTVDGGGTTQIDGGSIRTAGGVINISDSITLGANATLDTTNNGGSAGGAALTVGAVTGGGFNLTLTAGNGAGSDVGGTSTSGVNALTLANIGGTASFTGNVTATSLTAGGTVNNVALTGTGNTITNAVAFANTGTLTLGQAAGTQTYTGGLTTTGAGGTVTLNGTIKTTDTALTLGAVTLGSATTLGTNATTGAGLTLGTVTGGGFALGLDAGTGGTVTGTSVDNVATLTLANSGGATFSGTIGAGTAGAVTLADTTGTIAFQGNTHITTLTTAAKGYNVSFTGSGNTVDNAAAFLNTGTLTLGDAATDTLLFTAGLTATAPSLTTVNGAVSTTNAAISLGDVTTSTNASVDSGTNTITINGGAGALDLGTGAFTSANAGTAINISNATTLKTGNLTANSGTINLGVSANVTGAITQNGGTVISAATLTGSGASSVALGNSNTVTNLRAFAAGTTFTYNNAGALNVTGAVGGGSGLTSLTATGGTLAVTGTGSVAGAGATLVATGAGHDVTLDGAVNGNAGPVSITAARNVTQNTGGDIATSGNVSLTGTAGNVTQTGTGKISGAVLTTNSVTGTTLNAANTVAGFHATNSTSGNLALTNTAAPLAITGLSQAGAGAVTVTNTGSIDVTGPVSADGDVTIYATGAGAQNLAVSNNITGTGAANHTLTLQADNSVVFNSSADVSTANALNVVLNSNADGSTAGAIGLSAGTVIASLGGNITLGGGASPATVAAVGLAGGSGVSLDGATLDAGGGNISIRGAGATGGGAAGVLLNNTAVVTTGGSGTIFVDGTSTGTAGSAWGTLIWTTSKIEGTGSGTVTVQGTSLGQAGTSTNIGLFLSDGGQINSTSTGAIVATGTGGAGDTANEGLRFINGSSINGVGGPITVTGTAGAGDSDGIVLINAGAPSSIISTGAGAISITGTGAGAETGLDFAAGTIGGGAATGDILLRSLGGTGLALNGTISTAQDVTLNAVGGGGASQGAGAITAGGLRVEGSGSFALNSATNNVTTLAGSLATGSTLAYTDTNGLAIGSVTSDPGTGSTTRTGLTVGATGTAADAITLAAGGTLTQSQAITAGSLTTSSGGGTTLNDAGNALGIFNATNGTSGNVALTNNANLTVTGVTETGGGDVTVTNTGDLTTSGSVTTVANGNIGLTATTGALTLNSAVTAGGSGTVTLTNTGGGNNLAVNAAVSSGSGALTANSSGTISGTGTFSTSGLLTTSSVGGTTLSNGNTVGSFTASNTTGGDISLDNTIATLTVTGISNTAADGAVSVTNNGNLTNSGTISTAANGDITLAAVGGTLNSGTLSAGGSGAISLTSGANLAVNSTAGSGSGDITLTSGGDITQTAILNTTGLLTTSSVTGTALTLANTVGSFKGTNTTSGNLSLTNTAAPLTITGLSQTGAGAVTVTNTGSINLTGPVTADGDVTLYATGGGAQDLTVSGNITGTSGATQTLNLLADNTIVFNSSADISTTSSALNVILNADADGSGAGAIQLNSGTVIASAGGDITLGGSAAASGNARGTAANVEGVLLDNAQLLSGAGAITIHGRGWNAAGDGRLGVGLRNSGGGGSVVQSSTGTIAITGTGGNGTNANYGVLIDGTGTSVNSTGAGGNISITGTGGAGTGSSNAGLAISGSNPTVNTTGGGTITLTGTRGNGTDSNDSVSIQGTVASNAGSISITGNAGGTVSGDSNLGVNLNGGGQVNSTGAATVTITGTGADGGALNIGVDVNGAAVTSSGAGGNISITGTGGAGTGNSNVGVAVRGGGSVTSTGGAGGGTITIAGTRGNGADNNESVFIGDTVSSVTGNIQVTGNAGGTVSGGNNAGVTIAGGLVSSTGTATVTVTGTGGDGATGNHGIRLISGGDVTSTGGALSLTGTGGGAGGATDGNAGVYLDGAGTTVTATNAATVSITGTGNNTAGNNMVGVRIGNGAVVSAVDGDTTITGTAGAAGLINSFGAHIVNGSSVVSTGAGNISITGTGTAASNGVDMQLGTNTVGSGTMTGTILVDGNDTGLRLDDVITANTTATAIQVIDATALSLEGNVTTGPGGTLTLGGPAANNLSGAVTQTGIITAGTLTGNTGSTVDLSDANVVDNLGAFTSTGLTLVDSTLGLTVTGVVNTGAGALSLQTTGGDLAVNQTLTSTNVTLTSTDASIAIGANIDAGNGGPGGTATLTAGDQITRSAGTLTSLNALLSAANGIGTAAPIFTTVTNLKATNTTANNIQITNTGALTLHNFGTGNAITSPNGNLNVTAGGGLTQSGPVSVGGTTSLNAGANPITLTDAANDFTGAVDLTGTTTAITDANALTLGTLATGDLTVNSTGLLNLGQGTVTGNLVANSGGFAISQTGGLTVTGTSGLTATGAAITLTQAANDFQGTVTATGTGIQLTDANALTTVLTAGGASTLIAGGALVTSGSTTGLLTTTTSGGAGSTTTFGTTTAGSMNVTSTGAVSQTGTISTGAASFSAAGQTIDLTTNGAANDFTGAVDLTGTTTTITDANALTLGTLATGDLTVNSTGLLNLGQGTVTGNLVANSGGFAISQTGGLTVTGTSGLTATGAAITLTQAANDFQGTVTATGANIQLTDATALTTVLTDGGASTLVAGGALVTSGSTTGLLTTTTSGGAGSTTAFGATTAGSMNVTSTGAVSQTGTISTGAASFSAAGQTIDLTTNGAANGFTGTVNLTGAATQFTNTQATTAVLTTTGATTLTATGQTLDVSGSVTGALLTTSADATNLGTLSVGSANLTATGGVTQGGALTDAGALTVNAAGQPITLTQNNAVTGTVNLTGAATQFTNTVATTAVLATTGATTLTATGQPLDVSGSVTGASLTTSAAATNLGTLNVGSADLTATGAVTQSGVLTDGGALTVSASGQPITLTQNNAVTGTATLTGAATQFVNTVATTAVLATTGTTTLTATGQTLDVSGSVTGASLTTSADATNLGTLGVGTTLTMTSSGSITQSGPITVGGLLTFSLTSPLSDILLSTQANDLGSIAPLLAGTVSNIHDLGFRNVNVGAKVPVIAPGTTNLTGLTGLHDLTLIFDNAPIDLPGITASGTLTISAGGAITDSGASVVPGSTFLDAHGFDITLDVPGNNFGTVNLVGANITLTNVSLVNLAGVSASGAFTLTSPGTLTVSSPINSGSTVNLASTGGDLLINATVSAGGDLTLAANNGSITASAGGDISAGGSIAVTAGNSIQLAGITSGAVTITSGGAASFISPLNLGGTFLVTAGGNVTFDQSLSGGALTVKTAAVTRFNGAINGLGSVTTDAPGSTVLAGGLLGVTNNFLFNDPVTVANSLSITGPGGIFNAAFLAASDNSQAITTNVSGNLVFFGTVGTAGQRFANFTTNNPAGSTQFSGAASVLTGGPQLYQGNVLLGTKTTFGASALTFNGTINATLPTSSPQIAGGPIISALTATSSGFTANVLGDTVFNGAVGQTGRLGDVTLSTTGTGTAAIHADFAATNLTVNEALTVSAAAPFAVNTTGYQIYAGAVTLGSDMKFQSSLPAAFDTNGLDGIDFKSAVIGTGRIFTVEAPAATVRAEGDLGATGARLASVSARGRNMVVGGDIWTEGNITLDIGTNAGADNDFLRFNNEGAAARPTTLDSATGEILLGSGAVVTSGGKTTAPLQASIFKSNDGDLYLFAHKITMEPFERLAVRNGSLVAIADGTAAGDGLTMSSAAASRYLVLVAPTGPTTPAIHLLSRAPANVDDSSGNPTLDRGTELIAGAVFFFSSSSGVNSSFILGLFPTRTSYSPTTGAANSFDYHTFTGNILSRAGSFTVDIRPDSAGAVNNVYVADLVVTNRFRPVLPNLVYLDLSSVPGVGAGPDIPDTIFGGINLSPIRTVITIGAGPRTVLQQAFTPNVPREDIETAAPEVDLAPAVREQLQALGIYARALRPEERRSRLLRAGLFVTVPERERPRESDYEVADARVEDRAVRNVIQLATATGLIGLDQHKLDPVARSLATSFEAFSAKATSTDAKDFRAWLETSQDPDAERVLAYVKTLSATLKGIELLGLTRQELETSKAQIYGSILRARLNTEPEFFRALVEGAPAATRLSESSLPAGTPGIRTLVSNR